MLSFDADNYDINSLQDLSVDAAAVLKKREGRTIKAGGLWVYDNEIAQFRGGSFGDELQGVFCHREDQGEELSGDVPAAVHSDGEDLGNKGERS